MEAKRLALHEDLCELINITEPDGDRHVYFQPPPSVFLKYPAIVYKLDDISGKHANNSVYKQSRTYQVTVIDDDPDSVYADTISRWPRCRFDRHFTNDQLNHFVFTIQR